jgi:hypothetical protein
MLASSTRPSIAFTKSVIMYSAPLKMTSASCRALPIQPSVGPAVTSTSTPRALEKDAAASFIAGAGPPGP